MCFGVQMKQKKKKNIYFNWLSHFFILNFIFLSPYVEVGKTLYFLVQMTDKRYDYDFNMISSL